MAGSNGRWLQARADAVWVGWGFVAEHAAFADLCHELGIVFIGPDGDVMRRVGDKIAAKRLAEQAQIPVVPWSDGPVETLDEARGHAERLGYPLLIKATAGGGGHGIRLVRSAAPTLARPLPARGPRHSKPSETPTVFMEQLVYCARHVEVQIIADHYGTTWAAGVRDCTIQRRHQKILEEAPSPALSPQQDQALREAAMRLSQAAGYHNAGTVEFLYRTRDQPLLVHGDEHSIAGRTSGDRMHNRARSGETSDSRCARWPIGRRASTRRRVTPLKCG